MLRPGIDIPQQRLSIWTARRDDPVAQRGAIVTDHRVIADDPAAFGPIMRIVFYDENAGGGVG
jgi:hypothetical protein